jgi:hypothetical protein
MPNSLRIAIGAFAARAEMPRLQQLYSVLRSLDQAREKKPGESR